jgi:hypothetical protein
MAVEVGVEAGCGAFAEDFAHKAGASEGAKVVVDSGAGGTGIVAVDGGEDLVRCGVDGGLGQKREDGVALRRGP